MNRKIQIPDIKACAKCPLGPPDWQYKCEECGHKFEMRAPKGPSEERSRVCPECGSKNIKVLNIHKSEACAPGG